MSKECFSNEELFILYEIEIKRENELRDKWRNSLKFYITTILTIFTGAVVYINFIDSAMYSRVFIMCIGLFIIIISLIAMLHFKLDYKYQMEILTIQIKIEDMLGLSNPEKCCNKHRWKGEALLPKSYYENKKDTESSDIFVRKMSSIRKINYYSMLYYVFVLLGIVIVLIGLI